MIEIDASMGEGGGQIVRSALALAACTGRGVALHNVRARRAQPGLRPQHLAAVRAVADVCSAKVSGAIVSSRELSFEPGRVRPGHYDVDVGTAGSTMLVLETVLPALSLCGTRSEVILRGGTHNPRAPTFEFVRDSYLPLLARLGFHAQVVLDRHGFYPRGGGIVRASIEPLRRRVALELVDRGPLRSLSAGVLLAGLPEQIGRREIATLRERLDLTEESCTVQSVAALGAGNVVQVRVEAANVTTIFAGFGMRGVRAESVAGQIADEVDRYLLADVAIDARLADQLLLPLALAAGGEFTTQLPTAHTETNAAVIGKFVPVDYETTALGPGRWTIALRPRATSSSSSLSLESSDSPSVSFSSSSLAPRSRTWRAGASTLVAVSKARSSVCRTAQSISRAVSSPYLRSLGIPAAPGRNTWPSSS
jgi:RNA 3'-terminal phosphate cyclase (ATP)